MDKQREQHATSPRSIQDLPSVAAVSLPRNALQRAIKLISRLPESAQIFAMRIIAHKLAADFALRFLVMLGRFVGTSRRTTAGTPQLSTKNTKDAALIVDLTKEWAMLPLHLHITDRRALQRFGDITRGLQMMMDATPEEEHFAWVFDVGKQYYALLHEADLLIPVMNTVQIRAGRIVEGHATIVSAPTYPAQIEQMPRQSIAMTSKRKG